MADETKHYKITLPTFTCCGSQQFTYICKSCEEYMDCMFCGFNPYEKHDCA